LRLRFDEHRGRGVRLFSDGDRVPRRVLLRLSLLSRAIVLLCFLLPFVTLDASCGKYKTTEITGIQLLAGTRPEMRYTGPPAPRPTRADQHDAHREINDKFDVAQAGAITVFVLTALALPAVLRPRRSVAGASIALGLFALVALAVTARGSQEIGLQLAFGFSVAALVTDVSAFSRLSGRVSGARRLAVAFAVVAAVVVTQVIGIWIGSAAGP
jgi:hypothetical protein